MRTIRVFTKQVYGNSTMYVAGEPERTLIAKLTGKLTVSKQDLETLMHLGFKVVVYDSETMAMTAVTEAGKGENNEQSGHL